MKSKLMTRKQFLKYRRVALEKLGPRMDTLSRKLALAFRALGEPRGRQKILKDLMRMIADMDRNPLYVGIKYGRLFVRVDRDDENEMVEVSAGMEIGEFEFDGTGWEKP